MSAPVAAFNGVITINGEVTAGTCAIAVNGGTASATVTLPTVSTNALGSIGQTAGATGFNLALTSCPTTGSVRAYFENIGVEQTTGNLSNKAVASGGKNPAQVSDNVAAADMPLLSHATMQALADVYEQYAKPLVHQRW